MSVGKSTTGRLLQVLLSNYPHKRNVGLVTTDNFLFPNELLKKKKLMDKKGFPESYDIHKLIKFVSDLKSGVKKIKIPVYSHVFYDILPFYKTMKTPDIVIIEGLNVLQSGMDYLHDPHHVFISDFVDFSIYIDASESLLKKWYIDRLLKFKKQDFTNPAAYFYNFSLLSDEKFIIIANEFWKNINVKNLKKNILPTKKRANLILTKSFNHIIKLIRLRI